MIPPSSKPSQQFNPASSRPLVVQQSDNHQRHQPATNLQAPPPPQPNYTNPNPLLQLHQHYSLPPFSSQGFNVSSYPFNIPANNTNHNFPQLLNHANMASPQNHVMQPGYANAFQAYPNWPGNNLHSLPSQNQMCNLATSSTRCVGNHFHEGTRMAAARSASFSLSSPPRKLIRLHQSVNDEPINPIPTTPILCSPERLSYQLETYPPQMIALELPKLKNWQHTILKSTRDAMINFLTTEQLPKEVPNVIFTQEAFKAVQYAQKFEEYVFKSSDSHENYSKKITEKISSWFTKRASDNVSPRRRQVLPKPVQKVPCLPISIFEPSASSILPTPDEDSFEILSEIPRPPSPLHTETAPESVIVPPVSQYPRPFMRLEENAPQIDVGPDSSVRIQNDPGYNVKKEFMPLWKQLNSHEPESISLRKQISSVDGTKKQVTLITVKNKLIQKRYTDPWAFIEDMWLLFNNVLQTQDKSTEIYQHCPVLADLFQKLIEAKMRELGYCCGTQHQFDSKKVFCSKKFSCVIGIGENYYLYENQKYKLSVCTTCFAKLPQKIESKLFLREEADDGIKFVNKSLFCQFENSGGKLESFVTCVQCSRRYHRICVNHLESLSPSGFTCDRCLEITNKLPDSKPRARELPSTLLSSSIEERVNRFLTDKGVTTVVRIRVVSSCKKDFPVLPQMLDRYKEMPKYFPCVTKTILAFIENEDDDICFFGIYVQEYGSECPAPNTGRVYIAYLDSVYYFTPKEYRTPVYHEIILGYLDHAKNLGYSIAHGWICPAKEEASDFMFFAHPPEQKMPGINRLRNWYYSLLNKGIEDGIIIQYKNVKKYAAEMKMSTPSQIPYFEGDYWPETLEKLCLELPNQGSALAGKSGIKATKSKAKRKKTGKNNMDSGDAIWSTVLEEMDENKDIFIVVRLNAEVKVIRDPDAFIPCEMMESMETFVSTYEQNQQEFSTLRRVKHSSAMIVADVKCALTAVCDLCKERVFTWFNCETCNDGDYDLCERCHLQQNHEHLTKKMQNGLLLA